MTRSRTRVSVLAAAALLAASLPAAAQTPPDLRDLVGARAGQAESTVQSRGYVFVRTQEGGDAKWSYWRRGDDCVQITTRDGRYASIDRMDRDQCGGSAHNSGDAAAAVLAGVAVIGLAAALAHHNRNHNDRDERHDDDYSRGYQDALYGATYDRNDSEAYHDGYLAGEAERSNRRASNTDHVRRAPWAAQQACSVRADDFQNRPRGSSTPISVREEGDEWRMVMGTGPYRSVCVVSDDGRVRSIDPY
ncbi:MULTISPECIES: hypothetical protein [unclassified Brevundimonas]|uniref:hypothetical protein n=1 Tax=unclassified Brevundimonas TaxID=2622653 RepID=UPI0025B95139|nr:MULTISPECIES: hypothetical protein [unclassified Brevundimonas]